MKRVSALCPLSLRPIPPWKGPRGGMILSASLALTVPEEPMTRRHAGGTLKKTSNRAEAMKYRVLIQPDEDGVFVAEVPALPGCISQGATRDEAVANVREAIAGYLESLEAHGEPIPPSITEEIVEV
jgi:predicted RNase H-like HicB family nuclease